MAPSWQGEVTDLSVENYRPWASTAQRALGDASGLVFEGCCSVVWLRSAPLHPQGCFLTMTVSWYQSLIKVLLSRFPQSCRHFHNAETGTQYLVRPSPWPTCGLSPLFQGPLLPCFPTARGLVGTVSTVGVLPHCSLLLLIGPLTLHTSTSLGGCRA